MARCLALYIYIYIVSTPNLGSQITVFVQQREHDGFRGNIEGARESSRGVNKRRHPSKDITIHTLLPSHSVILSQPYRPPPSASPPKPLFHPLHLLARPQYPLSRNLAHPRRRGTPLIHPLFTQAIALRPHTRPCMHRHPNLIPMPHLLHRPARNPILPLLKRPLQTHAYVQIWNNNDKPAPWLQMRRYVSPHTPQLFFISGVIEQPRRVHEVEFSFVADAEVF